MATFSATKHILGYADPLVVSPGEQLNVQVCCHATSYSSKLIRLGPGHTHADAPPCNHQDVTDILPATHVGRPQFTRLGSYAVVPWCVKNKIDNVEVCFWVQSFLPSNAGHDQFLFSTLDQHSKAGVAAFIDYSGALCFVVGSEGGPQTARSTTRLQRHTWYHCTLDFDSSKREVTLQLRTKGSHIVSSEVSQESLILQDSFCLASSQTLTIASHSNLNIVGRVPQQSTTFNGKIDGFKIDLCIDDQRSTAVNLDFGKEIGTQRLIDISGNDHHGILVNCPTRGVKGHDWDASEAAWSRASYGYGAIHFHDDDMDDARWETDFSISVPKGLSSGCYGVVIKDEQSEDTIPFFVRPIMDLEPANKAVFIVPTFTYTAYANDRMYDTSRDVHIDIPGSNTVNRSHHIQILEARPDLGISLYDSHNDGSGTTHSTTKRVVLNMRPDYVHWGFGGPRELPADLWFIGFLDRELGPGNYDVITDHDLSRYGKDLLLRYSVALSGSHPEYPTYAMLDAYDAYLAAGRFFMYLGGNGYYWVTGHDARPEASHRIEVRRADQGCRVFSLPPGEWHLALTGELGGLWRSRGRTPNRICGLGCDACGMGQGAPYGIVPGARQDPKLAFIFKGQGLEHNNIIGDFGLVQGAASGDEIDRLDYSLGTPSNAVIIATSKLAGGHSDHYCLFNEEIMFPMVNTTGTTSDMVRSDVVYFDTGSGGAVFGVGSINWVGSLAWKNYDNNVAQITANVLHEFLMRSTK